MQQQSNKVHPIDVPVLNASGNSVLPTELICLSQLEHMQRLRDAELDCNEYRYNFNMQRQRNQKGMAVPLRIGMERFAARQINRLPFLQSSNLMDEVLTGRSQEIFFEDILSPPKYNARIYQPHAVVEESMGFHL